MLDGYNQGLETLQVRREGRGIPGLSATCHPARIQGSEMPMGSQIRKRVRKGEVEGLPSLNGECLRRGACQSGRFSNSRSSAREGLR